MEKKMRTYINEKKVNKIYEVLFNTVFIMKSGYWRGVFLRRHKVFAYMGKNVYYHPKRIPPDACLIKIHDDVSIASNVTFIAHDIFCNTLNNIINEKKLGTHFAPIEIMNNVSIGSGVIIMPGIRIGENSIIAGGAVVTKNVPAGVIIGGNPGKVIGTTEQLLRKRINTDEIYWNEKIDKLQSFYFQRFDTN